MPREYTPAIDCTNQTRLPIALQPVTSNQIQAVGYCHDTKTLAVSFTRGAGNVLRVPGCRRRNCLRLLHGRKPWPPLR